METALMPGMKVVVRIPQSQWINHTWYPQNETMVFGFIQRIFKKGTAAVKIDGMAVEPRLQLDWLFPL